jgi:hypothetical protein
MQGLCAHINLCFSLFVTTSSLMCSSNVSEEHAAYFVSVTIQEWQYNVSKRRHIDSRRLKHSNNIV